MMKHMIWDYGTPVARITDDNETAAILREIKHEFIRNGAIQYSHKVGVRLDIDSLCLQLHLFSSGEGIYVRDITK